MQTKDTKLHKLASTQSIILRDLLAIVLLDSEISAKA